MSAMHFFSFRSGLGRIVGGVFGLILSVSLTAGAQEAPPPSAPDAGRKTTQVGPATTPARQVVQGSARVWPADEPGSPTAHREAETAKAHRG